MVLVEHDLLLRGLLLQRFDGPVVLAVLLVEGDLLRQRLSQLRNRARAKQVGG